MNTRVLSSFWVALALLCGTGGAQEKRLEVAPGISPEEAKRLVQRENERLEKHKLRDGMMLDKGTASQVKDLLPAEILSFYEKGEYQNAIQRYPAEKYSHGPDWDKATEENGKNLDLDARGAILDKRTGKDPGYVFGWPFPKIDPNDPRAALKIAWNNQHQLWASIQTSTFYLDLTLLNRHGVDRAIRLYAHTRYWDGVPKSLLPATNPLGLTEQTLAVVEAPQDVQGTAQLSWRFREVEKRDLDWAYVPALRRVRAVSPANRSDGFLGSDISQDDGSFFDGKRTDFEWKLAGQAEMLCLGDPLALAGEYPKRERNPKGGWRDFIREDIKASGYVDPNWKGIPWAPDFQSLTLRPVWLIEAVPKDKYYLYGKIQLVIDKETWEGCYNRKWSWKGELLHDYMAGHTLPMPQQHDGAVDYLESGIAIYRSGINFKLDRATNVNFPGGVWIDRQTAFADNFFDYQTLSRFGK
jgi:hypothetical protein